MQGSSHGYPLSLSSHQSQDATRSHTLVLRAEDGRCKVAVFTGIHYDVGHAMYMDEFVGLIIDEFARHDVKGKDKSSPSDLEMNSFFKYSARES